MQPGGGVAMDGCVEKGKENGVEGGGLRGTIIPIVRGT